jgi:hypothetical protein
MSVTTEITTDVEVLSQLDDDQLKDMGLTRREIESVVARRSGDVPRRDAMPQRTAASMCRLERGGSTP